MADVTFQDRAGEHRVVVKGRPVMLVVRMDSTPHEGEEGVEPTEDGKGGTALYFDGPEQEFITVAASVLTAAMRAGVAEEVADRALRILQSTGSTDSLVRKVYSPDGSLVPEA